MIRTGSVAEAVVARIRALGVSCVFSVPGGLCSGFDDALHRSSIRVIVCQHEAMAAYAAAGFHRATGLPGIVVVTGGPGVLNCAAPLAAARLDHDGVIVLGGDVAHVDEGRGVLQDGGDLGLDLVSAMRPLCGVARRGDTPRAVALAFEDAVARARGRRASPTLLLVPIDVQRAPASSTVIELPVAAPPRASEAFVRDLVEKLSLAPRPTILVGRGAMDPRCAHAVLSLAERLAAPVIVDADALGLFSHEHPLVLGAFGVADDGTVGRWLSQHAPSPLIAIGARLDDTTTSAFASSLFCGGVIQLDEGASRLGLATDPIAAFSGDLEHAIDSLLRAVPRRESDTFAERARAIAAHRRQRVAPPPSRSSGPLHPVSAAAAVLRALPREATITADIGNHMLATLRAIQLDGQRPFELSLGLGGMGSGVGMALGMALGGRPHVTCICGDGTLAMAGNDLMTAVKYAIPLTLVAFQDGHLGMVRHGIRRVYGQTDEYSLPNFDIASWARALGAEVSSIDSESALERAVARRSDGPRLIVVPIDPEAQFSNPRETVINFPEASR